MVEIAAAQVKKLRDKTGAGMMDCKKALVETGGDSARALDLLRERGQAKARSKAGRATSDGAIVASVSDDARRAALIEVNCETDFVARTEKFKALCAALADLAREERAAGVEALLGLSYDGATVNERVTEAIAKLVWIGWRPPRTV
jgi:elongation factor Ts